MEVFIVVLIALLVSFAFGGGFYYLWEKNDKRGWTWYGVGFGGLGILSLIILT